MIWACYPFEASYYFRPFRTEYKTASKPVGSLWGCRPTVNYCQLLAAAAVTAHTATPPPLAHSPSHGIKLCQGEASLRLQRISGVLPAVNCSDAAVWLGGAVTGS